MFDGLLQIKRPLPTRILLLCLRRFLVKITDIKETRYDTSVRPSRPESRGI